MAGPSTRLRLRVSPRARSNAIVGKHGRVGLPQAKLKLVSAPLGRDKIVELSGIDAAEAERRLGQPR